MLSTILFILAITISFYLRRKYTYWARKGVPGPKPVPFFGNIFHSFTKKKTVGQIFREFYRFQEWTEHRHPYLFLLSVFLVHLPPLETDIIIRRFGPSHLLASFIYIKYDQYPLIGAYRSDQPVLIVRDPEFISRILVKDSKYFYNNDFFVDKNIDPLQAASPFFQKDEEAKETRASLSPGFTSGKIKHLYTLIGQINQRLLNHLSSQPNISEGSALETMNLCRRYTLDNVALTAFGIDGKCFDSDESDFMKLANAFINPATFALTMLQVFPIINKFISMKVISQEVEDGLTKIISDVIDYRKSNNIVTNDFLQFISETGHKKGLTVDDITGHAATFFEDGYETSALVLSYVLFNLAQNPDAQQKVRDEITMFENKSNDKKISYEELQEMSYLNACINESMRRFPVLEHYTRVCSQPYVYTTANEAPPHLTRMAVNIDAGTVCIIPFGGLCHDKRYFPDPDKFIPERFLDKDNNNFKGLFYPFGGGHRVCLGQKFGIMQVRTGVIEIIKNFEVTTSPKTKLPFEFLPWTILNKVKHGVWLTFRKL